MKLSQQECIEKITMYEKETKDKMGGILTQSLIGIPADKPGYIHELVDEYGGFSKKPMKLEKGFKKSKKRRFDKQWAIVAGCNVPKTKKEKDDYFKKMNGALHYTDWFDKTRKSWITIGDIMKLKKGDKLDLLMLDRNATDTAFHYNKMSVPKEPSKFFRHNRITYIHDTDMTGTIRQKIVIDLTNNKTKKTEKKRVTDNTEAEFDVEYKKDYWYPFRDGVLPAKDFQGYFKLLGKKKHYTDFPKSTHVGFRGPLIPWSQIDKFPKVYQVDDEYID